MSDYPKEYFNLINPDDKKIFDKELKTKQLTYFQDAMLRFGKNKYNVIASIILVFMIFLSVAVPMLTPEELYSDTNGDLTLLPPRVPIVENIGFLDGTNFYKNVTVDISTVSETTGLGYPTETFDPEHIDFSTLENETQIGELIDPSFTGGTNNFTVADGFYSVAVYSPNLLSMGNGENLHIDIESINAGTVEVYVIKSSATYAQTIIDPVTQEEAEVILISEDLDLSWDESPSIAYVGSVDQAGVSTVEFNQSLYGVLVLRYVLEEPAAGSELASLNSLHTTYGAVEDTVVKDFEGYELAVFKQISLDSETENGNYKRKDAERLVANFVYDNYSALFSPKHAFRQGTEYDEILANNPGMEDSIKYSSTNPNAWTFGEGYPVTEVINYVVSEQDINGDNIIQDDERFYTYELMLDGKYKLGYEEIPYFYFGTDVGGKDLFSLIWLGLRTSLLLGFLAAATNIFFGIIWGSASGYYGGQVDILMERFTDIWGSFPQITMISIITVIIGPGFLALYIFMVYDGWIGAAKITRMQFYRYKGREYVLAARTLGASDRRIIFKHILPNALGTIVTRVVLSIPAVIFLEVNLSYLGFGIGSGQSLNIGPLELTGTSIGVILAEGQKQILAGNLWLIIYPTIVVSILMITFNMFGNALRDALNPQLRGNS